MIATVGIVGAGLMGHGIALTFARAGLTVRVHDPAPGALEGLNGRVAASMDAIGCERTAIDDALRQIVACPALEDALGDADLAIEAVPELLDLKRSVFLEMQAAAPEGCVLASNTSVLPITGIASGLASRERVLGTIGGTRRTSFRWSRSFEPSGLRKRRWTRRWRC